jgi:hypothetical protein
MDASTETKKVEELSLTQTAVALLRHYLGGRRGLILLAVTALGAALVLNWGWLVAVGLAPLLLALAPCAAMCAIGLCANKMMGGNNSCSTRSSTGDRSSGTGSSPGTLAAKASDDALTSAVAPTISRDDAAMEIRGEAVKKDDGKGVIER